MLFSSRFLFFCCCCNPFFLNTPTLCTLGWGMGAGWEESFSVSIRERGNLLFHLLFIHLLLVALWFVALQDSVLYKFCTFLKFYLVAFLGLLFIIMFFSSFITFCLILELQSHTQKHTRTHKTTSTTHTHIHTQSTKYFRKPFTLFFFRVHAHNTLGSWRAIYNNLHSCLYLQTSCHKTHCMIKTTLAWTAMQRP